jgi:hypothetical protein
MNKSQKEFEAWVNQSVVFKNPEWLPEVKQYNYTSTQVMWEAWQASRAALVVELPDVCDLYPRKMLESELIKKIEKAGVKYK